MTTRTQGRTGPAAPCPAPQEGAWNPGLESELPRALLPLATVFRPENVRTSLATAHELADYCGLPAHELVAFRPERLIVHELLIRVTARIAVPDGLDYEDLGRNFRTIASTILERHIVPQQAVLLQDFWRMRRAAAEVIAREVAALVPSPTPGAVPAGWRRFIPAPRPPSPPPEPPDARARRIVAAWSAGAATTGTAMERACFRALSRVATAITSRRGRLFGDRDPIAELALTLVCNDYGSEVVGNAIAPVFDQAVIDEGFRLLGLHARPVVMNVKGASAAGKSSMRPFQRLLAGKIGLPWDDFALISPDIWRKFLLDYGSLGPAYKYAGMLTGHELEIVDKKLDRHMAHRAERGEKSHLLIDRFRFDSFVPPSDRGRAVNLLTRFGDLVYMFFMITPPEMTVARAWTRGLKVGRYKAVEDLLAHNVEAFAGMPELFFTWALDPCRRVHYEFLDNSGSEGRPPRTAAFGWNGEMTILDLRCMLDIDRFRKINIHARHADEVHAGHDGAPARNVAFLERCARLIPVVHLADQETGRAYARLERGRWTWRDPAPFARALDDPEVGPGLRALASELDACAAGPAPAHRDPDLEKLHTLGAWAEEARPRDGVPE